MSELYLRGRACLGQSNPSHRKSWARIFAWGILRSARLGRNSVQLGGTPQRRTWESWFLLEADSLQLQLNRYFEAFSLRLLA